MSQEPTRVESLSIKLKFDPDKYHVVADTIANLCGWEPTWATKPGDTLNLNYLLEAAYFGDVEKRLNQVLTLLTYLDSEAVVEVDSSILDEASCLLVRVADKLREIKTIVDIREGTD